MTLHDYSALQNILWTGAHVQSRGFPLLVTFVMTMLLPYLLKVGCIMSAVLTLLACLLAQIFAGLLVGAMLPYWFSAMTMKSVGKAALAMVEEVRRQFNTIPGIMEGTGRPDYRLCVEISTQVLSCAPVQIHV